MIKKCISVLLSVIMIFGVFTIIPFPAFAATSGTTGDCTWTLDGTVLVISGDGKMGDYSVSDKAPWEGSVITEVIIENGVSSIGNCSFLNCKSLTNVSISDSVESIGSLAFTNCTNLADIDFPESLRYVKKSDPVTGALSGTLWYDSQPDGIVYISNVAYTVKGKCPEKLVFRDGTISVSNRFCCDALLREVVFPDSVYSIGEGAFFECINLSKISFGTSLTKIGFGLVDGVAWTPERVDNVYYAGKVAIGGIGDQVVLRDGTQGIADDLVYNSNHNHYCLIVPNTVVSFGLDENIADRYIDNDITICGYQGSPAQEFATKNSIKFVELLGKCSFCDAYLTSDSILKGVPATCTEDGLTDGMQCLTCERTITKQEVIPKTGHKPLIDPAEPATCQHEGHTAGAYCENCGEVYVATQVIPKLEHTEVIDEAVEPDCTHTGLTAGLHCSVCGETIVKQNTVPALGHTYAMIHKREPSYFHAGHGEGVQCTRCGDWLIEPDEIPMLVSEGIFCDIDGDEEVSSVDVTLMMRWLADMNVPVTIDELWADVDDDGELSVMDVTLIQRWLAGLSSNDHIGYVFD